MGFEADFYNRFYYVLCYFQLVLLDFLDTLEYGVRLEDIELEDKRSLG